MRTPAAPEILDAWETALGQSPVARALSLVALASPEASDDELALLSVGRRDGRLLRLRRRLFGSELCIVTSCPQCSVQLQSTLSIDAIVSDEEDATRAAYICAVHGYRVGFRLPTSRDLIELTRQPDAGPMALLERCVIEASDPASDPITASALPESVIAAIAVQAAEHDPVADVQLRLTCPQCAHAFDTSLDIAGFLWKEIHAWAQRMLRDVHALAAAYGWREDDVLRLSPTRRQIYLNLARR